MKSSCCAVDRRAEQGLGLRPGRSGFRASKFALGVHKYLNMKVPGLSNQKPITVPCLGPEPIPELRVCIAAIKGLGSTY